MPNLLVLWPSVIVTAIACYVVIGEGVSEDSRPLLVVSLIVTAAVALVALEYFRVVIEVNQGRLIYRMAFVHREIELDRVKHWAVRRTEYRGNMRTPWSNLTKARMPIPDRDYLELILDDGTLFEIYPRSATALAHAVGAAKQKLRMQSADSARENA